MKLFHYPSGREAGETMTVGELRKKLDEYHDDLPVFGAWEGVEGYITEDSFYTERVHKGQRVEECECLMIDVEKY